MPARPAGGPRPSASTKRWRRCGRVSAAS